MRIKPLPFIKNQLSRTIKTKSISNKLPQRSPYNNLLYTPPPALRELEEQKKSQLSSPPKILLENEEPSPPAEPYIPDISNLPPLPQSPESLLTVLRVLLSKPISLSGIYSFMFHPDISPLITYSTLSMFLSVSISRSSWKHVHLVLDKLRELGWKLNHWDTRLIARGYVHRAQGQTAEKWFQRERDKFRAPNYGNWSVHRPRDLGEDFKGMGDSEKDLNQLTRLAIPRRSNEPIPPLVPIKIPPPEVIPTLLPLTVHSIILGLITHKRYADCIQVAEHFLTNASLPPVQRTVVVNILLQVFFDQDAPWDITKSWLIGSLHRYGAYPTDVTFNIILAGLSNSSKYPGTLFLECLRLVNWFSYTYYLPSRVPETTKRTIFKNQDETRELWDERNPTCWVSAKSARLIIKAYVKDCEYLSKQNISADQQALEKLTRSFATWWKNLRKTGRWSNPRLERDIQKARDEGFWIEQLPQPIPPENGKKK